MNRQKSTLYIVQAAVIAALYVVLTMGQEMLLPSTTSMAVQFRVSEALTMLAVYTPAAIPGLTVGCFVSNLLNVGALPIDMVVGSLASFMAAMVMYWLRNFRIFGLPVIAVLMPAIFNGVIVGLEIEIFFIEGPFNFVSFLIQGGLVALGELGVCIIIGLPLAAVVQKLGLDRRVFRTKTV